MKTHEVKSWPEFFAPVESGDKPFDLRFDDRHYAINDLLRMREWVPKDGTLGDGTYTGRECTKRITWIMAGVGSVGTILPKKGLSSRYVILGLAAPKRTCHRGAGDPPAECDWPGCGCDEATNQVLANLTEQGLVIVPRGALTTVMESMESGYAGDALEELRRAL